MVSGSVSASHGFSISLFQDLFVSGSPFLACSKTQKVKIWPYDPIANQSEFSTNSLCGKTVGSPSFSFYPLYYEGSKMIVGE